MKKTPPEAISKYSAYSIPNPCTKCCTHLSSGIDNSGPDKGKLIISRPGCSQTLSFLLSKIEDLISEINNCGQWEESEAKLIF
jgi:hypothetical protein